MESPASVQALERFFTTDDVAERYRTVAGTVRYWRVIGYGPRGAKVGRRYLYPESEIRRFDAELLARAQRPQAARPTNDDSAGGATPTPSVEPFNGSQQIGTSS